MIRFNAQRLAIELSRKLRDNNLSLLTARKESGISTATLSRMCNGNSNPNIKMLSKIAEYLKVDPMTFIDGDEYLNLSTLPVNKKKKIQKILREQVKLTIVSEAE